MPFDPLVVLAMIAAVPTAVAGLTPIIVARLARGDRIRERLEDKEARDAVAAKVDAAAVQAERAAVLLRNEQQRTAAATAQVARTTAATTLETRAQLGQIHTLVNSEMTAARQAELTQTRITLSVLKRLTLKVQDAGCEADQDDLAMIEVATARICELEAILADRAVQGAKAEADRLVATQTAVTEVNHA
jgi:hypothetical protein